MKKTKPLSLLATVFLLAFCALAVFFALQNRRGTAEKEPSGGIVLTPFEDEHENETPAWQKNPTGDRAVIETDRGTFTVSLFPSESADLFVSRVNAGLYDNTAFSVLAENLFAQVPPVNGDTAAVEKNDLAAIYGAIGFVLDGDKAASTSLALIMAKTLSGLSRAYLEENPSVFNKERVAFYEAKGGVPEYENRLALFGQVVDGFDLLTAMVAEKTDGYTGGYHAETPVTVLSVRIEKPETE